MGIDKLGPKMWNAIVRLDTEFDTWQGDEKHSWETIRAGLLRLAERNAALEAKATRDFEWNTELLAANKEAEDELADSQRMFWCLLHSHKTPLIVHRDAMESYHKQADEIVRHDLLNGDIEFKALVRENVEG